MKGILAVDSGTLISISSSCLFEVIGKLSEQGLNFVVSESVIRESISYPIKVKRFELNALRISAGLKKGWLKAVALDDKHTDLKRRILETANSCYYSRSGSIKIIQDGEAETMALAKMVSANAIITDERTMRMLVEDAYGLRLLLQKRRGEKIKINSELAEFFRKEFGKLLIARSAEIIALAYEIGLLEDIVGKVPKLLEASLYALKYAGCALSSEEIESFLEQNKI
ncbi:MAG: hypothetical protein N3F05_02145 [Candidatus Diapherotrites archaeon]|nr:hypothetical protein [Candidatus Diapherotrites archaeon]